jgi:chemotaxis protein CheZ
MPVRQKVFRIEAPRARSESRAPARAAVLSGSESEFLAELKALRELIEHRLPAPRLPRAEPRQITAGDLSLLKHETDSIHRAVNHTLKELATLHLGTFTREGEGRASRELDAVVDGTERATQQILTAAEAIDEAANTLSASLRSEQEHALASDIRDQIVRIFEACNFQDLGGQRIAKVLETLQFVEDRVARMMEIWGGREAIKDHAGAVPAARDKVPKLVNGPKIEGDPGHASQQEIDALFA